MQTRVTKASASQHLSKVNEVQRLTFGVRDADKAKLKSAMSGKIKMSRSEAEAIQERLMSPVTHREVVMHAKSLGLKVPKKVLKEYGM